MSVDDRPTLSAPDDDPYLWLEEIEGERALDFVERQNRPDAGQIRRRGDLQRDRDIAGGDLRPAGQHPLCQPARRPSLQSLEGCRTTRAACGGEPRWLNFAKPNPAWEIMLDIDQLAADEGEDWLLSWDQHAAGNVARAILSLSRGGSDAVTLREFDIDTKSFVAGRLHAAGSQGRRRLDRCRYAAAVERLWRGHGDDFRLCADRPAMAARRACRAGAGDLRDHARSHGDVMRRRPTPATDAAGLVHRPARLLQVTTSGWATKPARRRSSICRPTSGCRPIGDWFAVKLRTAWTVGGRTYAPDTVLGISLSAFLAGRPQFHRRVRTRAAPRAAGLFLGRRQAGAVDSRRIAAGVRGLHAVGRRAGAARRCRGLPEIGVVDVWRARSP